MWGGNLTALPGFILLGFSNSPQLQPTILSLFLSLFLLTALGNLTLILLLRTDPQLHTPMYFFLSHLSFLDLCLSSTVVPKALQTFLLGSSHISFLACFAQMYFFLALVISECFLLGVMAYDRFVAICTPLLYTTTLSRARCYTLVGLVYTTGFLTSLVHTLMAGRLSFCQARSIDHFFCELPALLQLSCSHAGANNVLQVSSAGINILGPVLMSLVSYSYILHTIMKMPLARWKAFSTCASHLVAITIFFGSGLLVYVQPHSKDGAKLVAACYVVVTPSLNPLIYSLRNKEVKRALRK
ncbi:Olfactory receptor 1044, partial [Chaetura pelagica]